MSGDSSAYDRLQALGITLAVPPPPAAAFTPFVRLEDALFRRGHIARKNGKPWTGRLSDGTTVADGREAGRAVAIDLIAVLHAATGDLARVKRIVNLLVSSTALRRSPSSTSWPTGLELVTRSANPVTTPSDASPETLEATGTTPRACARGSPTKSRQRSHLQRFQRLATMMTLHETRLVTALRIGPVATVVAIRGSTEWVRLLRDGRASQPPPGGA